MFNRILCLGAHTDDLEIACGGTIARFVEEGKKVFYSTFSFAEKSLLKGFSAGTTFNESNKAASVLGVHKVQMFDYEVRSFPSVRQDILENMIELRNNINPDLVLTHSSYDTHQDHETIYKETFRAFKQSASIFGYESFKNNRNFSLDLYISLSDKHIATKIEAMNCYKSQIVKNNSGVSSVVPLASFRGTQAGSKYAECFEVIRMFMR